MNEAIGSFLIRADTVLRIIVSVCCLILFATLAQNGHHKVESDTFSVYNCQTPPLDFTFAIGLFGWLMASFLLGMFFADEVSSQLQEYRTQLVLIDLGFNVLWCFFCFIAFCWTTNQWTAGDATCYDANGYKLTFKQLVDCNLPVTEVCFTDMNKQAAGAGIAFSFFSCTLFGALAVLGGKKYFQGSSSSSGDGQDYLGAADPDVMGVVDDYEPGAAVSYEPMQDSYSVAERYDYDE